MPACVNCGSEIAPEARICGVCSYPVQQEPPAATSPSWPQAQTGAQPPAAQPNWPPPPGYQAPPQGSWQSPQAGPYPGIAPGAPAVVRTDGGAIASLICGILGLTFCPVILSIVALVLGIQAERRVKESAGALDGAQMAKAGWILGLAGLVLIGGFALMAIAVPVFLGGF